MVVTVPIKWHLKPSSSLHIHYNLKSFSLQAVNCNYTLWITGISLFLYGLQKLSKENLFRVVSFLWTVSLFFLHSNACEREISVINENVLNGVEALYLFLFITFWAILSTHFPPILGWMIQLAIFLYIWVLGFVRIFQQAKWEWNKCRYVMIFFVFLLLSTFLVSVSDFRAYVPCLKYRFSGCRRNWRINLLKTHRRSSPQRFGRWVIEFLFGWGRRVIFFLFFIWFLASQIC